MSLPLLIGVMVIASEYGSALQVRDVLDAATRDAARFLARAPLNDAGDDFDQHFKDEATQMVADRLNTGTEVILVVPLVAEAEGTENQFRRDYKVVIVGVGVTVDLSLLSLLDVGSNYGISDVELEVGTNGKPRLRATENASASEATQTGLIMVAVDTTRYDGPGEMDENQTCTWVMQFDGVC